MSGCRKNFPPKVEQKDATPAVKIFGRNFLKPTHGFLIFLCLLIEPQNIYTAPPHF